MPFGFVCNCFNFSDIKILGTKDCTYKITKFRQIIQSWTRNEDKDVEVGSIEKQLKIHYPIWMDEIKIKELQSKINQYYFDETHFIIGTQIDDKYFFHCVIG